MDLTLMTSHLRERTDADESPFRSDQMLALERVRGRTGDETAIQTAV